MGLAGTITIKETKKKQTERIDSSETSVHIALLVSENTCCSTVELKPAHHSVSTQPIHHATSVTENNKSTLTTNPFLRRSTLGLVETASERFRRALLSIGIVCGDIQGYCVWVRGPAFSALILCSYRFKRR